MPSEHFVCLEMIMVCKIIKTHLSLVFLYANDKVSCDKLDLVFKFIEFDSMKGFHISEEISKVYFYLCCR